MRNRFVAAVLAFMMVLAVVPVSYAADAVINFEITSTNASAKAGDEITFSVYVTATVPCTSFQYAIVVPEGLTYVAGSGDIDSNLKSTTKADADVSWTEATLVVTCASLSPLEGMDDLLTATFKCIIDADTFKGEPEITIAVSDVTNAEYDSYAESDWMISSAKITVTCAHANTEIVGAKEPTCNEGGHTGATYCNDCEQTIATGNSIDATGEHEAGEDDGDCTTPVLCKHCNDAVVIPAKTHVAGKDDGDCTTAVLCANDNCEHVMVAAKTHMAEDDDNNCITAVGCVNEGCDHVFVEAEDEHVAGTDDGNCTTEVKCQNQNCDVVVIAAKADHEANADDGDCTTAVTCKYCDHVFVEATTHVAEADDDDCTTAIGCANENCNVVLTPAADKHVAGEDDGDCTTPIKCENEGCEQNAVAANEHDFTGNYDSEDPAQHWHICNNEGCAVTDTKEAHSGGTATCMDKAKCEKCEQIYGTFGPCVDNNTDGQCDVCQNDMCDHVIVPVAATPETCTTDGNIAHYKCTKCERLYTNEDGTGRVDENDVIVEASAHKNATEKKEVAATCVAAGVKAHFVCPDCGGKYLTKTIDAVAQSDAELAIAIDPEAHKWDNGVVTVEPTVDAEGLKVYTCAHNPEHKKEEILPKKNPVSNITPSNPEGKEPTEPVLPFTDVKKSDWFYNDVVFAYENGLMNGTGNNKFSPAVTTDRAMIVTVLWRMEGSPVVASTVKFSDVDAGAWYAAAIDWASANGIVNGYGDGKFGPTAQITREQIMAILNRYAVYKGWAEDTAVSMVAQYTCSVWAENNVNWADLSGLLADLGVDVTDMTAMASRAELAAYLSRFMENIAK